jgi:hypothetical protein
VSGPSSHLGEVPAMSDALDSLLVTVRPVVRPALGRLRERPVTDRSLRTAGAQTALG